jgi:hypothetical protein
MENKNILLADFGCVTMIPNNNNDLIFNFYKGCVKHIKAVEYPFHFDYATADEVDSMGITCTPEVWNRWENNNEPIISIEVTLNEGFVWCADTTFFKNNKKKRFADFTMDGAIDKLAKAMNQIQFKNHDCKEDWTDIVYLYQKEVYGVEAHITKENRYYVANEFYGTYVHEDPTLTHFPIRCINNPLEVVPTIEYIGTHINENESDFDFLS